MRTAGSAKLDAISHLEGSDFRGACPVLLEARTEEFDAGWVYYYQSAQYVESGDIQDSLVGNAPLFVPRDGSPPVFVRYHRPLEVSLQAFGACGNPNANPIARIALSGWEQGALALSAIQAIREQSELGLAAAKDVVDRCLAGENVQVDTKGVDGARELAAELRRLHFRVEVCFV